MPTEARPPRGVWGWLVGLALLAGLGWLLFKPAAPAVPAAGPDPLIAAPATAAAVASAPVPVPAPAPARRIEIAVQDGRVVGNDTFQVKQGEEVELRFTSNQAISLHLHGYELHAGVKPGEPGVMAFKAENAGRFPVHEHREGPGNHRAVLFVEVQP
jgi:hypothetical protein